MSRKPRLKANRWALCHEAIESGIRWGFVRWYKYREEEPLTSEDGESLVAHLQRELESAFSERFHWED